MSMESEARRGILIHINVLYIAGLLLNGSLDNLNCNIYQKIARKIARSWSKLVTVVNTAKTLLSFKG